MFTKHVLSLFPVSTLFNINIIYWPILCVSQDSFTRCFKSIPPEPWNWNIYLFPLWCMGVLVRYLVLFPLRLVFTFSFWGLFDFSLSSQKEGQTWNVQVTNRSFPEDLPLVLQCYYTKLEGLILLVHLAAFIA